MKWGAYISKLYSNYKHMYIPILLPDFVIDYRLLPEWQMERINGQTEFMLHQHQRIQMPQ